MFTPMSPYSPLKFERMLRNAGLVEVECLKPKIEKDLRTTNRVIYFNGERIGIFTELSLIELKCLPKIVSQGLICMVYTGAIPQIIKNAPDEQIYLSYHISSGRGDYWPIPFP